MTCRMRYLISHNELEQLLGRQEPDPGVVLPHFTVIYFTANWCGACRRLDLPAIEASLPEANWLKGDVDVNSFSAGFCNVRSIPTFCVIADKKLVATLGSSETGKVIAWLREQFQTYGLKR